MPATEFTRKYMIDALQRTYAVLAQLLSTVSGDDWDERWHPDRFTMREMTAHIADWDSVWQDRIQRMLDDPNAELPVIDESQLAEQNQYASLNPQESLRQFGMRRRMLVKKIVELPPEAWDTQGVHPRVGRVNLFQLVSLIVCHDMYHLEQASQFASSRRGR